MRVKGSDIAAALAAICFGVLLVYAVVYAIQKQGEIDDTRTKAHVGMMDPETRRVVGGGR